MRMITLQKYLINKAAIVSVILLFGTPWDYKSHRFFKWRAIAPKLNFIFACVSL